MDDLLAMFDEAEDSADAPAPPPCKRNYPKHPPASDSATEPSIVSRYQKCALSVDDRVGIRLLHRKISGVDLLNLITDHPYHSPAQLSAYSLAHLNKILSEPATILDVATVNGKTELITVGIVFTNSGTRLSSSGNAFCVLTIGSMSSGPSVTVLLFGTSYGEHCRTCPPGRVIAVVNPRLLPPKTGGNNSTTITFSVSDGQQVILAGDARDYGCCKAMTAAKNENGQWVSDGKPCKRFVDKRIGDYCQLHRKQVNGAGTVSGRGGVSLMQNLRRQATAFPTAHGNKMRTPLGTPIVPVNVNTKGSVSTWLAQASANSLTMKVSGNSLLQPHGVQYSLARNKSLLPVATAPEQRGTMTLAKNTMLNPQSTVGKQSQSQAVVKAFSTASTNPLLGQRLKPGPRMTKSAANLLQGAPPARNRLILNDRGQAIRTNAVGPKRRAVNSDTAGFNGSVLIPAPSRISRRPRPPGSVMRPDTRAVTKSDKCVGDILALQQLMAAQESERKAAAGGVMLQERSRTVVSKKQKRNDNTAGSSSLRDSLFGAVGDIDREFVLSAKSRFAYEADAEEYARSRRVVCDLEQDEFKKFSFATKKAASQRKNPIEKEWHCRTCGRSFSRRPDGCFRLNHNMKIERNIREEQSIGEKRLALTEKKAEDGGLVLGSGLEWSRWNRFT